jgi:hypothetical protein
VNSFLKSITLHGQQERLYPMLEILIPLPAVAPAALEESIQMVIGLQEADGNRLCQINANTA